LNSSKALNGRETALDPKGKDESVKHILYLEECVFGLTISDVRRLAFQIAEASLKLCSLCSQSPLWARVERAVAPVQQGTPKSRVRFTK
jgi:hypothetical protein